jgi:hypothetical protein
MNRPVSASAMECAMGDISIAIFVSGRSTSCSKKRMQRNIFKKADLDMQRNKLTEIG